MKKLLILFVVLYLRLDANDYSEYYIQINQAELKYVEEDFKGALIIYKSTFKSYKEPFLRDIFTACQIAYLSKDFELFIDFSEQCFLQGMPIGVFGSANIFKSLDSNEELKTKFICFGKTGLQKDYDEEIVNYNSEDDKKVLCLMVDEGQVNYNEDIPFVRTLFKVGRHFEYQLVKRSELLFVNDRNGMVLDYFDCDF